MCGHFNFNILIYSSQPVFIPKHNLPISLLNELLWICVSVQNLSAATLPPLTHCLRDHEEQLPVHVAQYTAAAIIIQTISLMLTQTFRNGSRRNHHHHLSGKTLASCENFESQGNWNHFSHERSNILDNSSERMGAKMMQVLLRWGWDTYFCFRTFFKFLGAKIS